jgi:pimeloyl-[acyl-carrier protein] methyl ester esterase
MRCAYASRGQGPDLVLVHGWALHGGVFEALADLPGHGHAPPVTSPWTAAEVIAEWSVRLPPALWLGWSLGGTLAQAYALSHPERCRGLVVIAASARFAAAADWPHGMPEPSYRDFLARLERDPSAAVERFLALEALGSPHELELVHRLRALIQARALATAPALRAGLEILHDTDLRAALPRLGRPSLWLAGARDRVVHPDATRASAELAGGRAEVLTGAGHAPFLTHLDVVADRLLDWLGGCR